MIRKLRLKIVGISLVAVAAVLLSALVILALSTRSQMVHSSEEHLAAALEGNADKNQLPGSSGQPCFVAEVFTGGTIRLSGSSYYNLENQDLVLDIVRSALEEKNDSGVLKDYSLRYMRRVGVVSVRIAFTDCSMERATMRSLLLRGGLVTLTALLVLTGLSYWLAGFAVRPVRRAWQEQKQFVSDASHELKTPLTVILSSTELAGGERDPEKTKQYVEGIRAESLRMKALVEDMLTLARTESGAKQTLDAVNLSDTVLESALAFEPVAFESGRELSYNIQPELTVRGSAVQLRRLADILLDNAMKYAAAGTPVGLLLRREGRGALLQVENRGETIPAEKLPHLFDRFYRVNHLFDTMWKGITPDSPVVTHEIPEQPLDAYSYYGGDFIDLKEAKLNKGWKYVPSWRADNTYEKRRGFVDVPMLEATRPGDKLTLDFTGKAIGIFCTPGPTAGILEYSIDGAPFKKLDTFTEWSKYLYIPWVYMLETELDDTAHKLVLRISKEKNPNSLGTECQIRNFVVNK